MHKTLRVGILSVALLTLTVYGCNQDLRKMADQDSSKQSYLNQVVLVNDYPSMGVLRPGMEKSSEIRLKNISDSPVFIEKVKTGCPCLTAFPDSIRIAPGDEQSIFMRFDPTHEPEFRGKLAVPIEGLSELNAVLFRAEILLEIAADET